MKKAILSFLLTFAVVGAWSAIKPARVYLCGFAASFNDSTVYFTDVQQVDSAYLDTKTKFLYSRDNYSYQLKEYLKGQNFTTPTCVTLFATDRKKLEKKMAKMRKKYSNGKYIVKGIKAADFTYEAIKYEE